MIKYERAKTIWGSIICFGSQLTSDKGLFCSNVERNMRKYAKYQHVKKNETQCWRCILHIPIQWHNLLSVKVAHQLIECESVKLVVAHCGSRDPMGSCLGGYLVSIRTGPPLLAKVILKIANLLPLPFHLQLQVANQSIFLLNLKCILREINLDSFPFL